MADRKQVAVRLRPEVFGQLQRACSLLYRTQSQIVEESLREYFVNHHLHTIYQVVVDKECVALLKTSDGVPEIVEMRVRNGVPPSALQERYAARLNMPVELVVHEGEKP